MLLLLLACAAPEPVATGSWPETGCISDHQPQGGHTLIDVSAHWLSGDDGTSIHVERREPLGKGCWPALVLVPPGLQAGIKGGEARANNWLAEAGLVTVTYDPRGRGRSEGDEQYGGPLHQDDLATVLSWTAALPNVDPGRVVIRSRSLGIASTAGALARHPELDPAALLDLEGPGRLPDDLDYASEFSRERLYDASDGDDWWAERSPAEHLGAFRGHYRRVQASEDHATGQWYGHAQALLNLAGEGEASAVDLNGTFGEAWTYDQVQERVLEGRVKHDDDRALRLLLGLY